VRKRKEQEILKTELQNKIKLDTGKKRGIKNKNKRFLFK
jgi:hypothetical protein